MARAKALHLSMPAHAFAVSGRFVGSVSTISRIYTHQLIKAIKTKQKERLLGLGPITYQKNTINCPVTLAEQACLVSKAAGYGMRLADRTTLAMHIKIAAQIRVEILNIQCRRGLE